MALPDYIAPLPVPVASIETLNKKDLWTHLTTYHVGRLFVNSKSTRTEMETEHDRSHAEIDFTQAERTVMPTGGLGAYDSRNVYVLNPVSPTAGEKRFVHNGTVHEHIFVSASTNEEDRKILNSMNEGGLGRILSLTERRALERLIDNDFAALRNEMKNYAKEILGTLLEEVTVTFAAKQKEAEKVQKAAAKSVRELHEKLIKQIADAKEEGITLAFAGIGHVSSEMSTTATVSGLSDAQKKVTSENQSDLASGLYTLERQRLNSQRLVLLAGVSAEGQKLLDTIPTAKTLMIDAAQHRAAIQITA